jgi:putative ABC transport system substrate-binding protein
MVSRLIRGIWRMSRPDRMTRRYFIAVLLVVAGATGRAASQQPGKVYRIAVVEQFKISDISSDPAVARGPGALFDELRRLGYVEGKNLVVERYSGEGRPEHFRALAGEVAGRNPDVVLALGPDLVLAFKTATATIPIVGLMGDPVALGIVSSLSRPGGNITGSAVDAGIEVWGKRLELLREAVPRLSRLGFLLTPSRLGNAGRALLKEACDKRSVSLVGSLLDSPIDEASYRRAFAAMEQEGADAVYVGAIHLAGAFGFNQR